MQGYRQNKRPYNVKKEELKNDGAFRKDSDKANKRNKSKGNKRTTEKYTRIQTKQTNGTRPYNVNIETQKHDRA